jgi:hypothetical protein
MASFGHVAIGMAAGRFWAVASGRKDLARTMVAFSALSLAADLDEALQFAPLLIWSLWPRSRTS